ncbi:CCCH zinc finger protein [Sarocladium implicatum]|nr:CCCH zinc finger protein [Sarocladium implicatum]
MTDEEKELLARIGQLAGQINRHKNRQSGERQTTPNLHPAHHHSNAYRQPSRPYSHPAHRVGRPHPHRHRTLQLNSTSTPPSTSSNPDSETENSGWVSKTDRHRQLINADVYAKKSADRAKAIEETKKRNLKAQSRGERARFNAYLKQQTTSSSNSATASPGKNDITIEGIKFRVMDGGKKLFRLPDDANIGLSTPKTATVAGVKFHRTKTGNFVANRVLKDQRRSGVVKLDQLCKIFSMTGSCQKGARCRYVHDPQKVAVCKDFLKGKCANGESCDLSHELTPERVPNCLHFAKGHCAKADCPYTHSKASPGAPVCKAFGFYGYCSNGADCTDRHVFECPDFSNTGRCKNKGCKLPHRERASVLRNQNKDEDDGEDVSSDEEAADSDDVDSDAVAEFIEADSEDSDFENSKDFIPL